MFFPSSPPGPPPPPPNAIPPALIEENKKFPRTRAFLHRLRHTFATLAGLPIPTLSAISSLALGGGLELALATTLRVFAPSAVVGLPETRLAIIPGAGGTYRLSALVGRARALDLILTGRRIVGTEAYRIGLCEWVAGVAEGMGEREKRLSVLGHAVERAREICEGGPGAVGAVVRAVRGGMEGEEREYEGLLGMADRMEALRAFQEKRGALFRGV